MGAWGPGLYSDDYALDLRSTIAAVCRLPSDGPEIVGLLCDLEPASQTPGDEDYATFWLVVADQLQRRGIASQAQSRALAIIDDGSSIQMSTDLGMSPADLAKRQRNLEKLKGRLSVLPPDRPRRTLKKPQSLLLEPGQAYVFPTDSRGNCVNPYFTDKERPDFTQVAWGAFLVVATGHALGYLAWYELAPSRKVTRRKPSLRRVVSNINLSKRGVGTLTRLHATRMQLELIGVTAVAATPAPSEDQAIRVAAADISIANLLSRWGRPGSSR